MPERPGATPHGSPSGARPVARLGDSKPSLILCAKMAEKGLAVVAVRGECPVHGGDACLYLFVTWTNMRPVIAAADDLVCQRADGLEDIFEDNFLKLAEALGVELDDDE